MNRYPILLVLPHTASARHAGFRSKSRKHPEQDNLEYFVITDEVEKLAGRTYATIIVDSYVGRMIYDASPHEADKMQRKLSFLRGRSEGRLLHPSQSRGVYLEP